MKILFLTRYGQQGASSRLPTMRETMREDQSHYPVEFESVSAVIRS